MLFGAISREGCPGEGRTEGFENTPMIGIRETSDLGFGLVMGAMVLGGANSLGRAVGGGFNDVEIGDFESFGDKVFKTWAGLADCFAVFTVGNDVPKKISTTLLDGFTVCLVAVTVGALLIMIEGKLDGLSDFWGKSVSRVLIGVGTGAFLGFVTGVLLGIGTGALLGLGTGAWLGLDLGALLGLDLGALLGFDNGTLLGSGNGALLGLSTGNWLGLGTGDLLGVDKVP